MPRCDGFDSQRWGFVEKKDRIAMTIGMIAFIGVGICGKED